MQYQLICNHISYFLHCFRSPRETLFLCSENCCFLVQLEILAMHKPLGLPILAFKAGRLPLFLKLLKPDAQLVIVKPILDRENLANYILSFLLESVCRKHLILFLTTFYSTSHPLKSRRNVTIIDFLEIKLLKSCKSVVYGNIFTYLLPGALLEII